MSNGSFKRRALFDRRFSPLLLALSAVLTMNLYLFYGVTGEGPPAIARTLTVIDATIVLALANCALWIWFAFLLRKACREEPIVFR